MFWRKIFLALISTVTSISISADASAGTETCEFILNSKWVVLKSAAIGPDKELIFRRFAICKQDNSSNIDKTKIGNNLLMLSCPMNVRRTPYFTIAMPNYAHVTTIEKDSWIPELRMHAALSPGSTFHFTAEYRKGEFYIDLDAGISGFLSQFFTAHEAIFEFGAAGERIIILQSNISTETDPQRKRFSSFFDAAFPILLKDKGFEYTVYSNESMLVACEKYRRGR